nr:immunoglobulin light chain junction region [Macaca mulatta]
DYYCAVGHSSSDYIF